MDIHFESLLVALVMDVVDACWCDELINLNIEDVEDKGSYLFVSIPDTATNVSRSLTIVEEEFLLMVFTFVISTFFYGLNVVFPTADSFCNIHNVYK